MRHKCSNYDKLMVDFQQVDAVILHFVGQHLKDVRNRKNLVQLLNGRPELRKHVYTSVRNLATIETFFNSATILVGCQGLLW